MSKVHRKDAQPPTGSSFGKDPSVSWRPPRSAVRADGWWSILVAVLIALLAPLSNAGAAILLGSQTIGATRDNNTAGRAEAFQNVASGSGTVASISVYVDSNSASTKLVAGLYADSVGHPGALLTQGTLPSPTKGAWNTVPVTAATLTSGQRYWVAILGAAGAGTLNFRVIRGAGTSEASVSSTLATLPSTWATGAIYAGDSPVSAYVNSTAATAPALSLSPTSAAFAYTIGGNAPAAKTVSLANTGSGTLTYTVASNAAWLTASPASGNAPGTVTLTPNVAGLAAGLYSATVTVTAAGAAGSPASIPVTLTVAAQPALTIAPTGLSYAYTIGGTAPAAKTVSLSNTGGGSLSYTAASNVSWLAVTPASGSAPAMLTVTPNVSGLGAGTYTGSITVTAAGASGSPASIAVTLTVSAAAPTLSLSASSLSFGYTIGAAAPAAQSVTVANTGGGSLSFTASGSAAWLGVVPTFGLAPNTLTVTPNISGLAAGTYTGQVTVTAAGIAGSPATIAVTLTVVAAPVLSVAPISANFAYSIGGPAPASSTINVSNAGTGTLTFAANSSAAWLGVSPSGGNAPGVLTLTPNVAGLAAGTYNALVTVTSTGASGSPAQVPVTLVVTATAAPVLSISPTAANFTYTIGGAAPSASTVTVANAGTGTLAFTASSNAAWLAVSPTGGNAPAALTLTPNVAGLAAGTYAATVTVTGTGATGSPASIPVTLTVAASTAAGPDWPMVARDSLRQGYAANDSVIDASSVANLGVLWDVALNGKVTAQPLYLSALSVAGSLHDVVVVATAQNSVYMLDANNGQQLWTRNFGTNNGGCAVPGGLGIRSAPALDRAHGRAFVIPDDGRLYTVSLQDGSDLAAPLALIDIPTTNKVRGGLNLNGTDLYVPTTSGGCDTPPWRGRIFHVDVSGTAPVLQQTFDTIPGITGDTRGGGIWGYGGVSVDPASGNVFAATGADPNQSYTPYGVRMIALDRNLGLLGTFEPPHPTTFPCASAPCDQDFGSTPTLFTPPGCPMLVAAGNKNGSLYVLKAADLAVSGSPLQALALNPANDWLGAGGLGGVPAYWPDGNMLFVTDAGNGLGQISSGIVGLAVAPAPACTLSVAWSKPLPNSNAAMSSPTVAGGVVFVGEGGSGKVHAFNALTGAELWNSGATIAGATFGAPMIAGGKVFVGSWNGSATTDTGTIWALSPGGSPPPPPPTPVLSVSPAALTFAYTIGGTVPSASALAVANAGSGTLSFTASGNAPWLAVAPAGGAAPASLTLTPNIAGLAAGTYTAQIVVAAPGASNSPATIPVTLTVSNSAPPPTCPNPVAVPLGDQSIGDQLDTNVQGQAEAFQSVANGCGTVTSISAYLDAASTSSVVSVGLYADNAGHPGALLAQGSVNAPAPATWVKIPVAPGIAVAQGTPYWIAILGTGAGSVKFRDRKGGCSSETSVEQNLTTLPATWTTGATYTDCPISGYGNTQ